MKAMPWVNILLGLWLIVSPFIIGYAGDAAAFWNSEVVGFMMVIITGVVAFAIPANAGNRTKNRSSV
ncbi:MAG TPA: SPW repeat protein [Candidatus Manganitrophaceae bacterium]|nr:SPW repeat protein [Candidatus Manganitrophaceae bacterium]